MTRAAVRLVAFGLCLSAAAAACRKPTRPGGDPVPPPPAPPAAPAEPIAGPFGESFDGGEVDPDLWYATAAGYRISDGALVAQNARNHPLWLRRPLPCDVRVDVVVWSDSPDGDIKLELFGDGTSFDPDEGAYLATGYVFIFGGWRNSLSTIARMDEHGARMVVDPTTRVEPERRYRFSIRVTGGTIEWYVDDRLFLRAEDPAPLCGPGHRHLGFNDWAVPVHFDDLTITPIG